VTAILPRKDLCIRERRSNEEKGYSLVTGKAIDSEVLQQGGGSPIEILTRVLLEKHTKGPRGKALYRAAASNK
jgi:hypothetical protein